MKGSSAVPWRRCETHGGVSTRKKEEKEKNVKSKESQHIERSVDCHVKLGLRREMVSIRGRYLLLYLLHQFRLSVC